MILGPEKRISEKALKVWRITGIIKTAIGWSERIYDWFSRGKTNRDRSES